MLLGDSRKQNALLITHKGRENRELTVGHQKQDWGLLVQTY